MREININEIHEVSGGVIPLLILAGKGLAAGFGLGAAAYGLLYATMAAAE